MFQNRLDILVILLVFAVSRILYYAVGVRFDTSSLPYFYQFLDVVWLKDDLLRSLWHLHSQPPLYNLMLGIGLKLFPDSPGPFWWGCSIAMGAAMSLMMQRSMVYLGVGRWLATVIALIYVVSPHTILYENWLFYTYPVTFLLIASVYFLARFLSRFTRTSGFLFFLTCCALILTRSAFHPLWLIASAFILLEWFPRKSKSIGIVFLIPFLLAVGWYGKNAVMFGKFSGSTWLGMSLAKGTIFRLPDEEREKWIEEGALSDISEIYPFGPIVVYEGIVPEHDPTGVPALDEPWKSNHKVNFNHLSFIEISDRYLEDSLKTIRRDPVGYGETLVRAFLLFFRPPSEMSFLDGNREKIETWNAFFTRWVTLQILPFEKATKLDREGGFPISFLVCCYFWMILFPLTLLYALRKALSYWGGNET
ncbi:MAG: hypothetical protein H6751_15225, partial [Candidatus Omnitrophica bacterium]|nr:hypothetical protein [Candidatus Omnitrophota bacterium]